MFDQKQLFTSNKIKVYLNTINKLVTFKICLKF